MNKSDCATYSVREIQSGNVIVAFDTADLTLMDSPNVNVDFQNLKATITWIKISDATKYHVFRKMGNDGDYKCIAILTKNRQVIQTGIISPVINYLQS